MCLDQLPCSGRAANPPIPMLSPAIVDGASLAYLAHRPLGTGRSELGAYAHGPDAPAVGYRLVEHIRAWGTDREEHPHITATTPGTTPESIQTRPTRVISERHINLVLQDGAG